MAKKQEQTEAYDLYKDPTISKTYLLSNEQIEILIFNLIENNFNISKACDSMGISRKAYYYMLKVSPDFGNKLQWTKEFINNIALNGILEGLSHSDLTLRYKYLDLLAKSGILTQVMGYNDVSTGMLFNIKKNDIETE